MIHQRFNLAFCTDKEVFSEYGERYHALKDRENLDRLAELDTLGAKPHTSTCLDLQARK